MLIDHCGTFPDCVIDGVGDGIHAGIEMSTRMVLGGFSV
jgi:hypothetical protein